MTDETPDLERRARAAIGADEPLRLSFPGGRLVIDHAGPLLAVHRCTVTAESEDAVAAACSEAHRLVTSQPAYLLASADTPEESGAERLAAVAVEALAGVVPRVLLVEVWSPQPHPEHEADPFGRRPGFTLYAPDDAAAQAAAEALADALTGIEIADQGAEVSRVSAEGVAPPGLDPLLPDTGASVTLGLAVDAVYVNPRDGEFYPGVLDELRAGLAPAFACAAEAFAEATSARRIPTGRRHLEPVAEVVDRGLSEISAQYGFLLQVTPVNSAEAWEEFHATQGETTPDLLYRPLTFDPDRLRRNLFALPVEDVEAPDVAGLLREKRDQTAVQVQMLLDRETPQFLGGSVRLYGAPDDDLVALACDVLAALPDGRAEAGAAVVGATAFAAEAHAEIAHYAAQWDRFDATVEVRHDIPGSLMVSSGQLLIGAEASVPERRVHALLAHEVGTHVVTYYNGSAQPLRVMKHGLAGYEGLQEGMAVLAEWLVGGLTPGRLRTLAARVLAARAVVDGSEIVETVRLLRAEAGLSLRGAFGVAVRVHRGGGLTKDMIYLEGLRDLLAHLGRGGSYWDLFVGKLALRHLEAVRSLLARGVLVPPPLTPRFAERPEAVARLERTRAGLSVLDLLAES